MIREILNGYGVVICALWLPRTEGESNRDRLDPKRDGKKLDKDKAGQEAYHISLILGQGRLNDDPPVP